MRCLCLPSSCKLTPPMRLVPFPFRSRKCPRKKQTRVAPERYSLYVSFPFLFLSNQPAYHDSNFNSQIFTHASQNTKCTLFTATSTSAEESMTRNERETEKRQAAIIGDLRRELNTAKAALNPKRTFPSFFSLSSPGKSG